MADSGEGYRGTGSGLIPEGWEIIRLGSIVRLRSKSTNPERAAHLPYVGLEHIDSGDPTIHRYGEASEVRSNKSRFYSGDVLYGKLRPYLDKAVLVDQEGICSTDILVLTSTDNVIPEFLSYLLHIRQFVDHAVATTTGVNHPRTSWSSIREFLHPLPPLPEQRVIARVLRTIQKARKTTEQVIASARELKLSLREHLFTYGPVSVDEAERVPLKESEVGSVPEHWKILRLGDIASIASGGTPSRKRPELWHGGIPWVKTGEVNYNVITSTEEKVSEQGLEESSARMIPAGTLLVAMYGQGITRGRVAMLGIDAAINQACAAVTPSTEVGPRFLYHFFSFNYEAIRNLGHGAHQKNLSATLLKALSIPCPLPTEQEDIVQFLDAMEQKIVVEENRKQALDVLFESLLHDLITGKVRVKDLELEKVEEMV